MSAKPLLALLLCLSAAAHAQDEQPLDDSDADAIETDVDDIPLDAYPSGGQTVACGTSPGLPLALGVVALVVLATRRRVRPGTLAALLIGASLFGGADAHAQDGALTPRIDVQRFEPCGLVNGFVTTCTGRQLAKGKVSFDGIFSYGWRPFQQSQRISDTLIRRVKGIDSLGALHLRFAVGATDWLQFAVSAPAIQIADAGPAVDTFAGPRNGIPVAAGDVQLDVGFRAVDEAKTGFGLAITPFATFPTGSRRLMLTEGTFGFGTRVAASGTVSIFHLAAHAAYMVKVGSSTLGAHQAVDDELRWGAGFGVDLLPDILRVNAEVLGASIVGPGRGRVDFTPVTWKLDNPIEADVDFVLTMKSGFAMTFGAGTGLTQAVGVPLVRGFVGFGYLPWTGRLHPIAPLFVRDGDDDGIADGDDLCPGVAEDRDGHEDEDGCPELDDDGDGVADAFDRCPTLAEDADGHDDTDGCPDVDDDADGIPDLTDACAMVPEDLDGVQDGDGCPEDDVDTDGDGLLDPVDACPAGAEDVDGFADDDGCPEADNDGDAILDDVDACPNEAEILNGIDDTDGCPDASKAKIAGDRIEIAESVQFYTAEARIRPDSHGVLDAVYGVLASNPTIARVRIEGHTDSQGEVAYNQDLSERRALAVRDYLIGKGIAPSRLLARGYGESYPIAPNSTDEGRATNRRVDFVILGPEDEGGL